MIATLTFNELNSMFLYTETRELICRADRLTGSYKIEN